MNIDELKQLAREYTDEAVSQRIAPLIQENKELHTLCQQLLAALKSATEGNLK